MEISRATYPALGFTVITWEGGAKLRYNHKTNQIAYTSGTGLLTILVNYDPDGEWFQWMDRCQLWK